MENSLSGSPNSPGQTRDSGDSSSSELSTLLGELSFRRERDRLTERFDVFLKAAWPLIEPGVPLKWSWLLEAICLHLQAVGEGKIQKLLINCPPGTAKSSVVSVLFPCWLWTRRPETKVMAASHGGALALRDSVRRRDLVLGSPWYRERWGHLFTMSEAQATKTEYANSATGFMFSTSVNGDVLGRRAELMLLDDPHKVQGAESEVERATTLRWLSLEWATRRNRDSSFSAEVCIMQRLHELDASGLFLEQKGWTHLMLPLHYEAARRCTTGIGWSDPRTVEGEVLDPARFTPEIIKELSTRLGPYGVAGQLEQSPAPAGGGVIKLAWLKSYKPELDRVQVDGRSIPHSSMFKFATVDLAVTKASAISDDPDYTCISIWGAFKATDGPKLFLLDVFRERIEGPDIEANLLRLYNKWRFSFAAVEMIAGFIALGQSLKRAGLPIRDIGLKADAFLRLEGDKVSRAYGCTPFLAEHGVYLPTYAPWLEAVVKEATTFPAARHDDFVDTLTSACAIVAKAPLTTVYDDYMKDPERPESLERRLADFGMHPGRKSDGARPEDLEDTSPGGEWRREMGLNE